MLSCEHCLVTGKSQTFFKVHYGRVSKILSVSSAISFISAHVFANLFHMYI